MTPKLTITENELVEALRSAMGSQDEGPTDARTVQEIVNTIGRSERFVRDNVRKLIAEGRAELVRIKRPAIDGRIQSVPAYRIKAA